MRGRALLLGLALAPMAASAGPPEPFDVPPPVLGDESGLWLSVELIGPRGAQMDAAQALATGPVERALPRGGRPPPGELVGRVATVEDALGWVHEHAFGPVEGSSIPAPAGHLLDRHGVVLTALVVTPMPEDAFPGWSTPAADARTSELGWRPATLTLARAPLYATPAPELPPASERYLVVEREHPLWIVDEVDHCQDASQICMRWSAVVSRAGARFVAGWMPGHWVVPADAWVEDASRVRQFAIRAAHHETGRAGFVVLERGYDDDGRPHHARTGVLVEHAGREWPEAALTVLTDVLTVHVAGEQVLRRELATEPTGPRP